MSFLAGKHNLKSKFKIIFSNSGWLLAYNFVNLLVGFTISPLVAQYLGPEKLGILNYSIGLNSLFGTIANAGIGEVLVREISKDEKNSNIYVSAAFFIQVFFSILSYAIMIIICLSGFLKTAYEEFFIISIVNLALFSTPFFIVNFYFQAKHLNKIFAIAGIVFAILFSIFRWVLLANKFELIWFGLIYAINLAILNFVMFLIYFKKEGKIIFNDKVRANIKYLLNICWPLIITGTIFVLQNQLDVIMIAELCNKNELGQFNQALRFYMMFMFVPGLLIQVYSPFLQRAFKYSEKDFHIKLCYVYKSSNILSVIFIIFFWFLGYYIVPFLWGEEFKKCGFLTFLFGFRFIFQSWGIVSAQYYTAYNLFKLTLFLAPFSILLNFFLNLILIPKYQSIGAYSATMITLFILTFYDLLFPKLRKNFFFIWSSLIFIIDKNLIKEIIFIIKKVTN